MSDPHHPDEVSFRGVHAMAGSAADFLAEVITRTIANLFSSISAG
ncbi:hypothetical protein ACWEVD_05305 [Nocardia thailandica]|uniref:Uncharacterized protein n=1 Tax=Nocardia thailandica TaxID=257275 RepID=A0ABW6PNF9_9NOCA